MPALMHPSFGIQLIHPSFRKPALAPKLLRCLLWVSLLSGLITLRVLPHHSPDIYSCLVKYLSSPQDWEPWTQDVGLLFIHGSITFSGKPSVNLSQAEWGTYLGSQVLHHPQPLITQTVLPTSHP